MSHQKHRCFSGIFQKASDNSKLLVARWSAYCFLFWSQCFSALPPATARFVSVMLLVRKEAAVQEEFHLSRWSAMLCRVTIKSCSFEMEHIGPSIAVCHSRKCSPLPWTFLHDRYAFHTGVAQPPLCYERSRLHRQYHFYDGIGNSAAACDCVGCLLFRC